MHILVMNVVLLDNENISLNLVMNFQEYRLRFHQDKLTYEGLKILNFNNSRITTTLNSVGTRTRASKNSDSPELC